MEISDFFRDHYDRPEIRLWLKVILEAIWDLTNPFEKVREEARTFISGQNGSLDYIMNALGFKENKISEYYWKNGPEQLRSLLVLPKRSGEYFYDPTIAGDYLEDN